MSTPLAAILVSVGDVIREYDAWHVVRSVVTSPDERTVVLTWLDASGDVDGCEYALTTDVDTLAA